jgi:hypothetical protein
MILTIIFGQKQTPEVSGSGRLRCLHEARVRVRSIALDAGVMRQGCHFSPVTRSLSQPDRPSQARVQPESAERVWRTAKGPDPDGDDSQPAPYQMHSLFPQLYARMDTKSPVSIRTVWRVVGNEHQADGPLAWTKVTGTRQWEIVEAGEQIPSFLERRETAPQLCVGAAAA